MKKLFASALVLLLLCSCGEQKSSESFFSMDTVMEISAYGKNSETAVKAARSEIERLDGLFDRNNENSDVYRLNARQSDTADADVFAAAKKALEISRETDGAFDFTVTPVMDLWGFYDCNYRVPQTEEIKNALKTVNYRNVYINGDKIQITGNSKLDFGGIAKGYASERAAEILRSYGIKSGVINLGGNVQTIGSRTDGNDWNIGIADPFNSEDTAAVVKISDKSVITSGGYQRFFEQNGETYHHIVNPSDGCPVKNNVKSVTVISSDSTAADALSTALFVMGFDKSEKFYKKHKDIDLIIISDDKTVYYTKGLLGKINIAGSFKAEEIGKTAESK